MPRPRPLTALLLLTAALGTAGCGSKNTSQHIPKAATSTDPGALPSSGPPPATEITGTADAPPAKVAADYVLASANWTYRNYATQYAQLVPLATGALHSQLIKAAPGRAELAVLAQQQQTNRATLLSAQATSTGNGRAHVYVLTMERAGAAGHQDSVGHHAAYQADAQNVRGRWLITAFTQLP